METKERDEQELRKLIKEIQLNPNISPKDKPRHIQALISNKNEQFQATELSSNTDSTKQLITNTIPPTISYKDENQRVLGCKHYPRKVKILADCCKQWFTCRICHDEGSEHVMDRRATQLMWCMHCFKEQVPAQSCIHCNTELAHYYCSICKFWDDTPKKSIYHCPHCGICRVGLGLGQDFEHCFKCGICMTKNHFANHHCLENQTKSNCPICNEYMFTSTQPIHFMECQHTIHQSCFKRLLEYSHQCPICSRSLGDVSGYFSILDNYTQLHMPPEYLDKRQLISCCDCQNRSVAKFHFLYHKCGHCGSYSTKVLDSFRFGDEKFNAYPDPTSYPPVKFVYRSPYSSTSRNDAALFSSPFVQGSGSSSPDSSYETYHQISYSSGPLSRHPLFSSDTSLQLLTDPPLLRPFHSAAASLDHSLDSSDATSIHSLDHSIISSQHSSDHPADSSDSFLSYSSTQSIISGSDTSSDLLEDDDTE